MTTIKANIPDYLAKLVTEAATKEKTTLDQIVALALSAQIGAWGIREDIESRARRGRAEDLRDVLARVSDAPPVPGDEL